jgi:segregation and condensation protein B
MPTKPKSNKSDNATRAEPQAARSAPDDTGLSLDQLSAAFAGMLNEGSDPYSAAEQSEEDELDEADEDSPVAAGSADEACEINPRSILEAMLFVGSPTSEPLTAQQVAGLMRGVRPAEVDALVEELNAHYRDRGCPYQILATGAGYRMALREEFARVRDKFYGRVRQARLSQAAIEVLATVAYHEPLSADDVNRLRAKPSGAILSQLVRRQLLRLERGTGRPRTSRYSTTARFLELFGLESLADLPRSQDLEEKL